MRLSDKDLSINGDQRRLLPVIPHIVAAFNGFWKLCFQPKLRKDECPVL